MPGELNYYQLLELSPAVDDVPSILRRISEMQSCWSQMANQGSEADRRRGAANLELIEVMRKELGNKDATIRRQHQEREQQRLDKVRRATMTKLDEFARVLRGKPGACTDADVKKIAGWLGPDWDERKVRTELERRGVSFTGAAPTPARDTLDPTTAKTLRVNLDFLVERGALPKPDLYDLLGTGFGPGTSCDQLRDGADRQEKDLRRRGKTDPISTARLSLLGQCRTLLGDPAGKVRYDNSRATQVMERFKYHLRLGAGDAKVILPQLADEVVALAADRGIAAETARQFIEDFAAQAKFTLLGRDGKSGGAPLQCGFCYQMAPTPDAEACRKCGKPLWIACPNPHCKTRVPTQDACCRKCGYATGNAPLFFAWLEEARKLLAADDLEAARQRVEAVLRGWRGYPEALELQQKIQQQDEELARLTRELQQLLSERRGEAVLQRLAGLAGVGLAGVRARAEQMVEEARRLVEDGRWRQAAGDLDAAVDRFEESLFRCVDCADARKALAACPPVAPVEANASLRGGAVELEWRRSPSRGGVRYRVLRKSGSAPRRDDDGVVIDTVSGTTLTDGGGPVGEPIYYAVYTERGGVASASAALAGPVFRVADVTSLRALGLDRCVELTWEAPPNACRVEVWRKPLEPPGRRGDGALLPVVGNGTASDSGLVNGSTVGYRAVAVYRGPDGQPRYAPGATATATPVTLPKPVAHLNATRTGDDVEVTWPLLAGASVAVFVSAQDPGHAAGKLLRAEDLAGLGRRLPALGPDRARGRVEPLPLLYLTAASVAGGTAVVGQTVRLRTVEEVTRLRVRRAGGRLLCSWDWPAGIHTALVAWRQDRYPDGPGDRGAQRETCQRFHYDQHGGFSFPAPAEAGQLFLTVYAAEQSEDGWQHSPGTTAGARREVPLLACHPLRYRFAPVKGLRRLLGGRGYRLQVTPGVPVRLPALVLVVRSGQVPLDREDGTEVLRIPSGTPCSPRGPLVEIIPASDLPPKPQGRLFPEDPNDSDWLDLQRDP
jgi:hypothetical protein